LQSELITQEDALRLALLAFFDGLPCENYNVWFKQLSTGLCICSTCVEMRKEKIRALHNTKRSPSEEQVLVSYLKEKTRRKHYRTLEKSKGINANRNKRYYFKNKARINKKSTEVYGHRYAKRRATLLKAVPGWDEELNEFAWKECRELKKLRNVSTKIKWQVDHMIPLQSECACGLHSWSNLQVIPAKFNLSKRNQLIFTEPGQWVKHL
jgi:hypothetical protein